MRSRGRYMTLSGELSAVVADRVRDVADYPKPGVVFKDITPLLADGAAFGAVVDWFASAYASLQVDKVVGVEARGFILAAPVAYRCGVGFVPVRKEGKLPAPTYSASYALEYGTATVEVHRDGIAPGDRVLVLDDVLATGGTAAATAELVDRCGGTIVATGFLVELSFLHGRDRIAGLDPSALLTV